MDSYGRLIVRALAADEALPISDVIVRITLSDTVNSPIKYTVLTDGDGVTEEIRLPAPDRSFSLTPTPVGEVSAFYDVSISREGYYSKLLRSVAVFSGVLSVLSVTMIPRIPYADGGRYPRENLVN